MILFGIPVSTTHAIAGSIMGVGATKRYPLYDGRWKTNCIRMDKDNKRTQTKWAFADGM